MLGVWISPPIDCSRVCRPPEHEGIETVSVDLPGRLLSFDIKNLDISCPENKQINSMLSPICKKVRLTSGS